MKTIFLGSLLFYIVGCNAQSNLVKDISEEKKTNYFLAVLDIDKTKQFRLNKGDFYVKTYIIYDSNATKEEHFEEYDGVIQSVLISIIPDGDYYTDSKLFKIEGLYNPRVLSVNKTEDENYVISIESGLSNKKKVLDYNFSVKFN